jgi:hypothetical protein
VPLGNYRWHSRARLNKFTSTLQHECTWKSSLRPKFRKRKNARAAQWEIPVSWTQLGSDSDLVRSLALGSSHRLLLRPDQISVLGALSGKPAAFGTDCEYVTKRLCEKTLNKRRCISYPWRCKG